MAPSPASTFAPNAPGTAASGAAAAVGAAAGASTARALDPGTPRALEAHASPALLPYPPSREATTAPRWFYRLTAACLVCVTLAVLAVSAAAVARLRLIYAADATIVDTWRRSFCTVQACVRLSDTVISLQESMHRGADYPVGTVRPLP